MIFYLGIGFAFLVAFLKAIDTLMNKSVMKDIQPLHHALYRILFVTPILFIVSIFHWQIRIEVIWFLLGYGALEAVNILTHQIAVKKSNPLHIEMISKSKVILTLIVSFVLMIDELSLWKTIGIIIFVIGTILTINFHTERDGERTGKIGIILEMISVLARTFKPFILKYCIVNGYISSEMMAFLSMPIAFVVLLIIFRPKLNFREISVKKYSLQALVVALSMLASGWAISMSNTVIVNAIESFSVFFIMLISYVLYKKKYKVLSIIGLVLSTIGIVLAIVL